jgi:CxxC motif-containing protein (DUF1111 family)
MHGEGTATFRVVRVRALPHSHAQDRQVVDCGAEQNANLFSDLALHNMGTGLADNISQGVAEGNEFRTAPLWGPGSGSFSCMTADQQSVEGHPDACQCRSEANLSVAAFNTLSASQQQSILNFLRSL